ncbi:MAG: SEC-C domain-containing protein [Planctomycetota bacterium]|jgi:hypothetical protein|nr:SEC-C domain-containing protein [Planctomycetota bacterium]
MKKLGPNAQCPRGSGEKYKKCCRRKKFDRVGNEDGGIRKAIAMTPELRALLQEQFERFRKRFGGDPEPDEPIFFDQPPLERSEFHTARDMRRAGLAPELVYAFEKTGPLVSEINRDLIPEKDLEEWDAAIEEHFEKKESGELDDSREPLK